MINKLIIVLFVSFSFLLFAQTPDWQWASQAGGIYSDQGNKIVVDVDGNSYIIGNFFFTATFGSYELTSYGQADIFIAKMATDGSYSWVKQAGGANFEFGSDITIDNNGAIYITGAFEGTAFFGSQSLTSNGARDFFIAKIDTYGNWQWVIQAGGIGLDSGMGVITDNTSNIYTTGYFENTITLGSYTLTSSGLMDIFVSKMDEDGNFIWVEQAGGPTCDTGISITLDYTGKSYITGLHYGPVTFGTQTLNYPGYHVAKIDENGNWLWAQQISGSPTSVNEIILDNEMNCYVIGSFDQSIVFAPYSLSCNGERNAFIAKMDYDGNWFWAKAVHGDDIVGEGITASISTGTIITGFFTGLAYFDSFTLSSNDFSDIFVAKINNDGEWLWVKQAGGSGIDQGKDIISDCSDNIYITGCFENTITFGDHTLISNGDRDIFVTKLINNLSAENEIALSIINILNYPNPFNPSTTFEFSIQNDSKVELSVFNIKGQKIKTIAHNGFAKGAHSINWDGEDEFGKPVSSGIYYYNLNVNGKVEAIKKCLLLK